MHTLWKGNTLYVLADVTDPTVDTTASDPWQQDSVELFVDAGNAKAGGYRPDDTQIRISADNLLSFGTGDETAQRARVTSATSRTDHGYVVEAAVSLLENGGLGAFEGLDFQVNDGTAGARTAIRAWADPTGNGYQTTARWGVGRLVAAPEPPAVAPVVTTQPVSAAGPLGSTVTFTAAASGRPTPTVQWQRKVSGTWKDVAGARSTSLTVPVELGVQGASYRAVFTNTAGKATTNAATLTVQPAKPTIVHQPTSVSSSPWSLTKFEVDAVGYPAPHYQWYVKLPGSTTWVKALLGGSDTLYVVTLPWLSGTQVRVVVSSSAGSVTSSVATLTVRR